MAKGVKCGNCGKVKNVKQSATNFRCCGITQQINKINLIVQGVQRMIKKELPEPKVKEEIEVL